MQDPMNALTKPVYPLSLTLDCHEGILASLRLAAKADALDYRRRSVVGPNSPTTNNQLAG